MSPVLFRSLSRCGAVVTCYRKSRNVYGDGRVCQEPELWRGTKAGSHRGHRKTIHVGCGIVEAGSLEPEAFSFEAVADGHEMII